MLAVINKYRSIFTIGLQSNLVYRWNFAVQASFSLVHLAFVFVLWGAAFSGQTGIGGFDLRQTLTYFVVMLALQFFIGAMNEDYEISEEIRNGLINQFLEAVPAVFAETGQDHGVIRLVIGQDAVHDRDG
jgi:ABC-2 type transport system permease protein